MLFLKCTAQATSMMREARGARTQLMRIQAERRKRELDNATRDQAAWTEHCAIGLMMQALPGAAPRPCRTRPRPARPRTAAGRRTAHDLAAEADLYAIMYPRRAVLIRALGGLPQPLDFGAPPLWSCIVSSEIPKITDRPRKRGRPSQGARLEAMSLQPAFAFFALFAVPFPCFDAIPHAPLPLAGKDLR